jgi:hypothetical protein
MSRIGGRHDPTPAHEIPDLGAQTGSIRLRENVNFLKQFNVICPVQSLLQKYSA